MKIKLVCVGNVRSKSVSALVNDYFGRIGHYYPFSCTVIADVKSTASMTAAKVKDSEGCRILAEVAPADRLILLDERGKELTSREFSVVLEKFANDGIRTLVFAIGGPYGFAQAVYDRADSLLSLSKMTFPHELARLVFAEQLYRAGTIRRGEPYHHD